MNTFPLLAKIAAAVVAVILLALGIYVLAHMNNQNGAAAVTVPSDVTSKPEASNGQVAAHNQARQQAPMQTPANNPPAAVEPGMIVGKVVDQYGKPLGTNCVDCTWGRITDALGENAGALSAYNGRLQSRGSLPPGTYIIQVPNSDNAMEEMTPVTKTIQLPATGINLGTIVVNRWSKVMVRLVNAVGIPLDQIFAFFKTCDITDTWAKNNTLLCGGTQSVQVLSVPNEPSEMLGGAFPPGNYSIRFSASGYSETLKSFTVGNSDVDLGTIVLQKQ